MIAIQGARLISVVNYYLSPSLLIQGNYQVTLYIAEFWNSVSNLFFIIPPLIVCYKLWHKNVERVYLMSLVYMAFTGIGSFAFHATLKFEMQLWDELSMVWSAIFILYLVLKMITAEAKGYALPLIAYGIFTNAVYLFLKTEPIIFQVAYAILHYSVLYLSYKVSKVFPCDSRLFYATLSAHHVAFLLWNIDNNFCGALEQIRSVIPSACEPFTQLHAVWHFLAGYGSFALVLMCIQARLAMNERKFYVGLDTLSGLTLQEGVRPVGKSETPNNNRYEYVFANKRN